MQKEILEISQLNKSYHQGSETLEILKDLDFKVSEGMTAAIVGASGSGKSTLMSLIAGLDSPNSGQVKINGQALGDLEEQQLTRFRGENLGIIFQQFHLMSHLSALENVQLPLDILNREQPKEKAKEALSLVNLSHRERHLPGQLSGGENQRVAIARSFVVKPRLLLADEPSGSLDSETGEQVMDLLFKAVADQKMTMVLVTHDRLLAERCDEIWELKNKTLTKI
ncbi:MAG: ABC transporter ATP-binding protein [Pseudobacteriovorax sp.]|nr:ABC transporter ATP-binding protein [Pseudobacteriovorax sp.]